MSEKEKMLTGKPYIGSDQELVNERSAAKDLLFNYNNLRPSERELRNGLLKKLLGNVGDQFLIEPPFRCDYGYNISVGENFYANYNLLILDCARVEIGENAFFAPNVSIYTAGHPIHHEPRNQQLEYAIPVKIGKNVWIGGNVVINPGINIGDNCVIGSGSVVTNDIPNDVLAVGNPCRVLRTIGPDDRNFYFKKLKFDMIPCYEN